MENPLKDRRLMPIYIVLTLIITIFIIVSLVNRFIVFNVIGGTKDVNTSTMTLQYTFNKELKDVSNESVILTTSGSISKIVKVEGKKLSIFMQTAAPADSEFSVELNNIESTSGSKLSKRFTYNVTYAEPDNLSKEEQQAGLDRSNSFETEYPLIKKLPLIKEKVYQITSAFPDSGSTKMPITIDCLTASPEPTTLSGEYIPETANDPQVNEFKGEIKMCRDQATAQLKTDGFNTDRYQLICAEPYLLDEYKCILKTSDL